MSVVPVLPPTNTVSDAPAVATVSDPGRVIFVGAGPGDPGLLTLRAVECLRLADVVVHDVLVPAAVLDAAGTRAERIPVARAATGDEDPGIAIGRLLVDLVRRHRLVVRLKGGDPSVFARLAEEQQPLREAAIPWEIVPGVTAALAAAAAAGVPLTSRTAASSVTFLTGHEACAKEATLDFAALARLPGTLVVYMGVEQVATWSRSLMAAGKSGDTPVTIVSRCSWPDQQTCVTTLARCGSETDHCRWTAPAIVIVGAVAGQPVVEPCAPTHALAGRTILVTRPAGQGADLAALIARHGGAAVHLPVIRIGPPDSWEPLDHAIDAADTFDWIVFASANGVRAWCERLRGAGRDVRHLGTARIAAIGPATAREAALHGIQCDLVPDEHRSEGIVTTLGGEARHGRFLLVRANRGRDVMRHGLEALGHHVTEVAAYASHTADPIDPETLATLTGEVDWITITSSFIAESAGRLFGNRLQAWKVASISPVTTAALAAAGVTPTVEADRPTGEGLVEAITRWEATHRDLAPSAGSAESARTGAPQAGDRVDSGTAARR
ncbi:MAG: uroporphyrinogen-III C-methyltransferase [Planctomycetia bacterium]